MVILHFELEELPIRNEASSKPPTPAREERQAMEIFEFIDASLKRRRGNKRSFMKGVREPKMVKMSCTRQKSRKTTMPILLSFLLLLLSVDFGITASGPRPETLALTSVPQVTKAPVQVSAMPAEVSHWEKVVAAAHKESKLLLFTNITGPARAAIAKVMKNKYGINVEATPGRGGELTAKFFQERRANVGTADIFIIGPGQVFIDLKPRNVLVAITDYIIRSEVKDPKAWPNGELPFLDKEKMGIALAAQYSSLIIVNTDMVKKDEIQSYRDLLDPKWHGKIAMYDPTTTGSSAPWATLILEKIFGWEGGAKYLSAFAKQKPAIIRDNRLATEWVARGKYPVGVSPNFGVVSEFRAAASPISWIPRIKEGGLVHPGGGVLSIPDKIAHPNAVTVMVNWLLSKEGQDTFSHAYGTPPVRIDADRKGFDPILFPSPGDKLYWADEAFIKAQAKAMTLGKKIFADLIK